jgi:hypothetical protein
MTELTKRNKSSSRPVLQLYQHLPCQYHRDLLSLVAPSKSLHYLFCQYIVRKNFLCFCEKVLGNLINSFLISWVAVGERGICRRSCTCIPLERIGLLPWCTSSGNPCNRWRVCSWRSRSPPSSPTHEEEAAPRKLFIVYIDVSESKKIIWAYKCVPWLSTLRLKSASISTWGW